MSLDGDAIVVRAAAASEAADVFLAVSERGLVSNVTRGENSGRTLHHGPILRELRLLGAAPLETRTKMTDKKKRYAVILQGQKSHRIYGSAALSTAPAH